MSVRGPGGEPWLRFGLRVIAAGPVLILLLLCVILSFASPVFLTEDNLLNLGTQSAVVAILALGMLLVILTRGIDLSVGSVVALAGTAGGLFARDVSESGLLTVLVMIAAGGAVGLFNGVLLVKGKAPHAFVVTLATLGIARGVALLIAGGTAVVGMPSLVLTLGGGDLGPVPWPIVIVVVVTLMCWVLTRWTLWGRWIYAVGGNPEAARRAGIPVDRVLMSVYIICGALAGLAGMIAAGQTNTGAPTGGQLLELDAITAVFIGGASFLGGRGTVLNAIVGALVLGVIRNGLNLLDVSPFYQTVAVGVAIAVAIQLDVVRAHLEERFRVVQARRAL